MWHTLARKFVSVFGRQRSPRHRANAWKGWARPALEVLEDRLTPNAGPGLSLQQTDVFNDNNGNGRPDAGETISYRFTVTNTGSVTLSHVTVTDPQDHVSGSPIASLAPGASNDTAFTATYKITQADINAGNKVTTATVTGTTDRHQTVSATATENVPLSQVASLALLLTGPANVTHPHPGSQITYNAEVINTGNVTLHDITLVDPGITIEGGPIADLAPGESSSRLSGHYTLTQDDIDRGDIVTTATATGSPPTGPTISSNPSTATVALNQVASLALLLTGPANVPNPHPGSQITYNAEVINTGNVTLHDITLVDPGITIEGGPIADLAPGESSSRLSGHYTLTQDDIDRGDIVTTATATGSPPTGPTISSNPSTATVALKQVASLALLLTGPANVPNPHPGSQITYNAEVINTGNVTLHDITLVDPGITIEGGPIADLAPGESSSLSGHYTVTQDDIDRGFVSTTATVTGIPPTGPSISSNPSTVIVTLQQAGSHGRHRHPSVPGGSQ